MGQTTTTLPSCERVQKNTLLLLLKLLNWKYIQYVYVQKHHKVSQMRDVTLTFDTEGAGINGQKCYCHILKAHCRRTLHITGSYHE